jgi:hypothetical protein
MSELRTEERNDISMRSVARWLLIRMADELRDPEGSSTASGLFGRKVYYPIEFSRITGGIEHKKKRRNPLQRKEEEGHGSAVENPYSISYPSTTIPHHYCTWLLAPSPHLHNLPGLRLTA